MGQTESQTQQPLESRFHLQKVKLGKGSFGEVFRGLDKQTQRHVAIKCIDTKSVVRNSGSLRDVEREIAMLKAVSHPNVLQFLGNFASGDGILYIVTEYCEGGDFSDKLRELANRSIADPQAARFALHICAAVSALHTKGICHRDIKPDNFVVAVGDLLKLADFGLAIFAEPGKLLQQKCGSPAFMAPELHALPQCAGYTILVDMWAVGVSTFMILCNGLHPFLDSWGQLDQSRLQLGTLDFEAFAKTPVSPPAQQFCKALVEPDIRRRANAAQAMAHPWLQRGMSPADTSSTYGAGSPVAPHPQTFVFNAPSPVQSHYPIACPQVPLQGFAAPPHHPAPMKFSLEEMPEWRDLQQKQLATMAQLERETEKYLMLEKDHMALEKNFAALVASSGKYGEVQVAMATEVERLRAEVVAGRTEAAALRVEAKVARDTKSQTEVALELEVQHLEVSNSTLLREVTHLKESNSTLVHEVADLKDSNSALLQEVERLNELNLTLSKQESDLRRNSAQYCEDIADQQKQLREHKGSENKSKEQLEQYAQEVKNLKATIVKIEQEHQDKCQELSNLHDLMIAQKQCKPQQPQQKCCVVQ